MKLKWWQWSYCSPQPATQESEILPTQNACKIRKSRVVNRKEYKDEAYEAEQSSAVDLYDKEENLAL